MTLATAKQRHLAAISQLLASSDLPSAGVETHLNTFVVAEDVTLAGEDIGKAVVGVGGLEIHGRFALLRSVAVASNFRRKGIASAICAWLEEDAPRRGISHIYLLTETAESFFANRGYAVIVRADAPAEITATEEFTTLCPDSAVLMVRAC